MRFLGQFVAAVCVVALMSSVTATAEEAQTPPPADVQTAAPAADPAAPSADPTKPAEDLEEVICKKLEVETGTRLGKNRKECRTRREWNQIAEESKQNLKRSQD